MEYAATTTPQQIGISESDGRGTWDRHHRQVLAQVRNPAPPLCEEKCSPPLSLFATYRRFPYWAEQRPTSACTTRKRIRPSSAQSEPGRSYTLRHIRPNWETKHGNICGLSHNRREYRIYNAPKGTIVENRNVNFLEASPYITPTTRKLDRPQRTRCLHQRCNRSHLLPQPIHIFKIGRFLDQDTTPARKQIQDMLRDNAPTRDLPERDRTLSTETKMTGVVSTASPGIAPSSANDGRATRAFTRGKLHDEDTAESDLDGHQLQQLKSLALAVGLPSGFFSQRRTAFRRSFCLRNRPR